jgi:hypothetical protein
MAPWERSHALLHDAVSQGAMFYAMAPLFMSS